jgi:polysaccharide biosynthesis/export protein
VLVKKGKVAAPLLALALALGGCAEHEHKLNLPSGEQAYQIDPPPTPGPARRDYVIGPLDKLSVTVFGEHDLSTDNAQVDASGNMILPLVGRITASGKTADALSTELRQRLTKYLVDPKVSVLVLTTVSQKIIVQGSVNQAGVYGMQGRATLLEGIAMARGASNVADERRVAIFRTINGQRMGAVFDISAIQNGDQADPELLGGDVVVVGYSPRRGTFHDALALTPALGLFVPLVYAFR